MLETFTDIGCSLIAIMLGRLQMDVDECIKHYEKDMIKIFGDKEKEAWPSSLTRGFTEGIGVGFQGRRYDPRQLEETVQNLVLEKLRDKDAMLLDKNSKCKVYGTPHAPKSLTYISSKVRHGF